MTEEEKSDPTKIVDQVVTGITKDGVAFHISKWVTQQGKEVFSGGQHGGKLSGTEQYNEADVEKIAKGEPVDAFTKPETQIKIQAQLKSKFESLKASST